MNECIKDNKWDGVSGWDGWILFYHRVSSAFTCIHQRLQDNRYGGKDAVQAQNPVIIIRTEPSAFSWPTNLALSHYLYV